MLEKYRKGKILIPEDRFQILSNMLESSKQEDYAKKITKREKNWGSREDAKTQRNKAKVLFGARIFIPLGGCEISL